MMQMLPRLGEMWQGGGKGYEDVVMITLGTGVGGGIIRGGKIVAGTNGAKRRNRAYAYDR